MRLLTLCAASFSAIMAASAAQAGMLDFTPDPSRVLSDPTYLPMKGKFSAETGYSYSHNQNTSYTVSTGAEKGDSTSKSHVVDQSIAYGLLDTLTLRADMSYTPEAKTGTNNVTGTRVVRSREGFSNPNFGITYRAFEQASSSPVTLDLSADYAPDAIDAERARNGLDTGSVALGGDVATLGTQLSYKTRSFTIAGLAGVSYYGDAELEVNNTTTVIDTDSYWGFYVGAKTQTRLTDRFSLDLNARYDAATDTDITNVKTGITSNRDQGDSVDFGIGLNYDVIPGRLVANLSYNYTLIDDTTNTFAVSASDTRAESDFSQTFGARLKYAF